MNGIVVVRNGDARTVTLSDRLRPAGIGFGVGWIHLYPASIHSDQLQLAERVAERSVAALGLREWDRLSPADRLTRRLASRSSRSPRGSPAARWPTSFATPSASISWSSRCASRSASRLPTTSRCRGSPSRSRSAS